MIVFVAMPAAPRSHNRRLLAPSALAIVPLLLFAVFSRLTPQPLATHRAWALAGFVLALLVVICETAALHGFGRIALSSPFWPALLAASGMAVTAIFWIVGLAFLFGSFRQYWLRGADPFIGWR